MNAARWLTTIASALVLLVVALWAAPARAEAAWTIAAACATHVDDPESEDDADRSVAPPCSGTRMEPLRSSRPASAKEPSSSEPCCSPPLHVRRGGHGHDLGHEARPRSTSPPRRARARLMVFLI